MSGLKVNWLEGPDPNLELLLHLITNSVQKFDFGTQPTKLKVAVKNK